MREIKFKAFLKTNKETYFVCTIDFDNDEVGLINDDGNEIVVSFSDVELMQYTGLKDKNGKEIYEGDILESQEIIYTVKWIDRWFCFRIFGKSKMGLAFSNEDQIKRTAIIIGNIFENPELLK